jgi:hypothetical protein
MPSAPARLLVLLLGLAPAWADTSSITSPEGPRTFLTFLPRPDSLSREPSRQLVQLLLDRQAKEGYDSYLIQVLFRGRPSGKPVHRVYDDRVEIDFHDTGKPSMRLARVRGGAIEATSIRELHYLDPGRAAADSGDGGAARSWRMVRLVLHTRARPTLRFRHTLDRTLIHFRIPATPPGPENQSETPTARSPAKKLADH